MVTAGLRERKKDRTRQALADAALELFTKNGFQATTVEEIAAAVEVSPRTFFRYFATKEEVLFGKDTEREEALAEFLGSRPAGEAPLDRLRASLLGYAAEFEHDREQLLRRAQVMVGTPSLRAAALAHEGAKEVAVTAALLAADPDADEAEVRLVVAVTFAAIRVTVERWLARGGQENLPALAVDALNKLGRGLDSNPNPAQPDPNES